MKIIISGCNITTIKYPSDGDEDPMHEDGDIVILLLVLLLTLDSYDSYWLPIDGDNQEKLKNKIVVSGVTVYPDSLL